jgi:peptidyl-prolyl cis-trans isomerase D
MLRFLRKYSSSLGVKILYGLLAALFVIWGVGAIGGEHVEVVARVHGEDISRRELDRATVALQRRYEAMLRDRFTADLARSLDLRGQALDSLIDAALLREEARRLGVTVTETEVVEAITKMPELQDNGRFDRDRLAAFLQQQRDRGEFEEDVRRGLLFDRLQALVVDGVQVSDAEVEERYRLDHEQVRLDFVKTPAADLTGVEVSDDDLQKYLAEHADRYQIPTKVRVRYVAYRAKDFVAQVEPKDGEIAEYYELHKEERFSDPEQVHVRQIVVKLPEKADEAAKAKARKKADDLLAKARDGGDFAALAKKSSDDAASAANGGDLGFLPHGRQPPALEEVAFGLEPGKISDVIETPDGFHIIKLEEKREAGPRPLDAVRSEIVDALKKERSFELARGRAEAARREIVRGKSLAEAAGADAKETTPFAAGEPIPDVGPVKDFNETAFTLATNEVSDLIETDDAIFLLTPIERIEAHTPPLADVRERVLADARRERGQAAAKERAEKLLARAKESGLKSAATESGAKVEESDPFDRRAATIPKIGVVPDLRTDAFTLTAEAPLAPKAYDAGGDAIVAALRERIPADMSGLEAAKDSVRDTILQQRRSATLSAYMDFLKERARQEGALEVRTDVLVRS